MPIKSILHYNIIKKLGEGGMGSVYLAEDTKLERKVALKFLSEHTPANEATLTRFANEARIAASLSHPNIAQIYSIEEAEGRTFLVLQYIDGLEIDEYLKKHSCSITERSGFAHEIARGLDAAHKKGIIHRDIKSGNIMISGDGTVKILDFGLAQLTGQKELTRETMISGTATYLSPELVMGKDATPSSDIWAYGVLLYQLFTDELPFDGVYEQAISYAILDEEPAPVQQKNPEVPDVYQKIIETCLRKKPEDRFSSFEDILILLEETDKTSPALPSERSRSFSLSSVLIISILAVSSLIYIAVDRAGHSRSGDTQKLAIIPFKNVGENVENAILLDGILETMTSKLSQIDNFEKKLWVIPSSEIIDNDITSVSTAQKVFGINLAVTGSVQDVDGKKRFTINLIDAGNLRQLKSSVIDISGDNITRLQTESVLVLISMLDITPSEMINETIRIGATGSPQATNYYINGKGYLRIHTQKENVDLSIEQFRKAVAEDPEFTSAYAALGESFWYKYELTDMTAFVDSALYYLNKAIQLNPELLEVRQTQGLLKLGTGNYEEAIAIFSDIIEQQPGNESAFSSLGLAYESTGDFTAAETAYQKAIELKPDFTPGHTKLGEFYLNTGKYGQAVQAFDQVLLITPDNYLGYSDLGVAYYYQSEFTKAILNFKRSLELSPNETAASNLGTVYYIQSNYEDAARYYEVALAVNPNNYAIWGNLASVQGVMGNRDKEQEFYRKAIDVAEKQLSVNPNDISLNSVLGSYYSDIGDTTTAIRYIEKTIDLAPDVPDVIFRAASAYENLGRRYRALLLMEKAIDLDYPLENILKQPELKELVESDGFKELLRELQINSD